MKFNKTDIALFVLMGFYAFICASVWWTISRRVIYPAMDEKITAEDLQDRLREAEGYVAVLETIKYYQQNRDNNGYSQNADHLLKVWNLCAAYADTITDPRWIDAINQPAEYKEKLKAQICSIDVPLFMFCACADESAYMPGAIGTNKNKTQDVGITQINQDCHAEIDPLLPADLRARAWTDPEKNIAGRYIWIMNRVRAGQAWDKMTQRRGWALYKRLKKKTAQFKNGPCGSK